MAKTIPLTNFAEYVTAAKAIQQNLNKSASSPAAVRQAVMDLTNLAVSALEEACQVFEGLAMVVLSSHPEVKRGSRRRKA